MQIEAAAELSDCPGGGLCRHNAGLGTAAPDLTPIALVTSGAAPASRAPRSKPWWRWGRYLHQPLGSRSGPAAAEPWRGHKQGELCEWQK